jgi:hypothetical protein
LPALPVLYALTFRFAYELPSALLLSWMVCWVAGGLLAFFTLMSVVEHRAGGDGRRWLAGVVLFLIYALGPVAVQIVTIAVATAVSLLLSP